jgi:hypothetical protein
MVGVLTDTDGINKIGRPGCGPGIDDPVYDLDANPTEIDFPSFTSFVAAMIVNDVFFCTATEPVVSLAPV